VARRRRLAGTFVGAALTVGVVACDTSDSTPAPIVFRAQAAGVSFESAFPAVVDLALGSNASVFTFSASATSNRGVWSVHATLTREQVFAGAVSLDLGSSTSALAAAQINGSTRLQADTGKLDVSFGQGLAAGSVTMASPDQLNSTFSGTLAVECLVPASAGTQPSDGSEALVMDVGFESEACMPFAILK